MEQTRNLLKFDTGSQPGSLARAVGNRPKVYAAMTSKEAAALMIFAQIPVEHIRIERQPSVKKTIAQRRLARMQMKEQSVGA